MGFAKDVVKYMFSRECINMFVCSFKRKHIIPDSIFDDMKDLDKYETKCERCNMPILCLSNEAMCYFTEDFDQTIEDCIQDHVDHDGISTKEFFKEMGEIFYSKEFWKNMWHEMGCQRKGKHGISLAAESKMNDGAKCVRTLCERCKLPLMLTIDKSDPGIFWIREDGGNLGAARTDVGLLFDKPGSYWIKDYKEQDVEYA